MKTNKSVKILIAILVVLWLPTKVIAQPVTIGPLTISFVDSNPDTINRAAGDFTADGFVNGNCITVSGSDYNDGVYTIAGAAALTLTLIPSDQLTNELSAATTISHNPYQVAIQKAG